MNVDLRFLFFFFCKNALLQKALFKCVLFHNQGKSAAYVKKKKCVFLFLFFFSYRYRET